MMIGAQDIARVLAQVPEGSFAPSSADRDPIAHVLSRLTFGVTPDLYDYVQQIGVEAYIEEQLSPDSIDDTEVERLVADQFPMTTMTGGEIAREFGDMRGQVVGQLFGAWLARALYSRRQLYERMVHFWSDHFYTYLNKGPVAFFKSDEINDVFRVHAFGRFRDLLGGSARSAAMLIFLDNAQSQAQAPNENYARELMELHTLGVDGGYTELDVVEVARCFTGWSLVRPREGNDDSGQFVFRARIHDDGEKFVLGEVIPAAGGVEDGERVLDLLASNPATARFVMTKLVRRFVSDYPPESLVNACVDEFMRTDGDTLSVLRLVFASDEFWNAPPRFKRPFEYTVGAMRALDYQIRRPQRFNRNLIGAFQAMGQVPFTWPAPNGFPDVGAYWMSNMLPRWNIAINVMADNRDGGPGYESIREFLNAHADPDNPESVFRFLAQYLYGRDLTAEEFQVLADFLQGVSEQDVNPLIASTQLLLAAPTFQFK